MPVLPAAAASNLLQAKAPVPVHAGLHRRLCFRFDAVEFIIFIDKIAGFSCR
jgi:hypothetical protein